MIAPPLSEMDSSYRYTPDDAHDDAHAHSNTHSIVTTKDVPIHRRTGRKRRRTDVIEEEEDSSIDSSYAESPPPSQSSPSPAYSNSTDQEWTCIPENGFTEFQTRTTTAAIAETHSDESYDNDNRHGGKNGTHANRNANDTPEAKIPSPLLALYDDSYIVELPSNSKDYVVEVPDNVKEGDIIYVRGEEVGLSADELIAVKVPPFEYLSEFSEVYGKKRSNGNINTNNKRYVRIVPEIPSNLSSPQSRKRNAMPITSPKSMSIHNHIMPSPSPPRSQSLIRQQTFENNWDLTETSSKVGSDHQVLSFPDPTHFRPSKAAEHDQLYTQIWSPTTIDQSSLSPTETEKIYNAVNNAPTNHKEIVMEALHSSNYNLLQAWPKYLQRKRILKGRGTLPGEPLPKIILKAFYNAIWETRKNLIEACDAVRQKGHLINNASLLVQYYNKYKDSKEYAKLKEITKEESDVCMVCNDGGVLIVCDGCGGAYHLDCLDPPLTEIPEGLWFCPNCALDETVRPIMAYHNHQEDGNRCNANDDLSGKKWTYWGINDADACVDGL